jgi:hypothetical protein
MLSFKITLNRHGAPRLITEYRKAFLRASKWWQEKSMTSRALPLKTDLKSLDGKPMGTIWATPNWIN